MLRSKAGSGFCVVVLWLACTALAGAALPTAQEILEIHRTNRAAFSQVHLQWVHAYETTEAMTRAEQRRLDEKSKLTAAIYSMDSKDLRIPLGDQTLVGEAAIAFLQRAEVISSRKEAAKEQRREPKPFRIIHPVELFRSGDAYQFRKPAGGVKDQELAAWSFSQEPVTARSLETTYANCSLFSRTPAMTPPARWWSGGGSTRSYVTKKHLTEVSSTNLPPYTDFTNPDWGRRHPYDHFFSRPAEEYRVVRQEEVEGRLLTVVDVKVPIGEAATLWLGYRGWLDLQRGAVPVRMGHSQLTANAPAEVFDGHAEFSEITTSQEIREFPGPAFYPVKIVQELWQPDPDAPTEGPAAAGEGKPIAKVPLAVQSRQTWDVSLVEFRTEWSQGFFEIPFPAGEPVFDHDAGRMVGGLEPQPLVKVGQEAPPLTVARWLDDRPRTLADLKGQVVVLSFWELNDGSPETRSTWNDLRKQFADESVIFLSIHCAEKDPADLAARIAAFQKETGWRAAAAIDAGSIAENSATTIAYGAQFLPLTVIVGRDGRIAYVDPQTLGDDSDEITVRSDEDEPIVQAQLEEKANEFFKARFETVGETWPIDASLSDDEQLAIHRRVEKLYFAHCIREALKPARQD